MKHCMLTTDGIRVDCTLFTGAVQESARQEVVKAKIRFSRGLGASNSCRSDSSALPMALNSF